uniref:Uncharacterized protein n=1 Tax=Amphimedon queenslandica TaxID=400682 RepID=A0A1X7VBC5_AMPQE
MCADCNPYSRNLSDILEHDEVLRLFCTIYTQQQLLCRVPPVSPKGGELYIFDLVEDSTKWDSWKRKFRCDQYRWVNKGVIDAKCSDGTTLKKRSNYIDREGLPRNKGDDPFRRWEFWGYGSSFILHYTGKDSIFNPFAHCGHRKDETARPFIRSGHFIKKKVTEGNSLQTDKQVYREIVNLDRGGPRHCVETPRNSEQLSFQLKFPNRRGDSTDFVSYISIHPRVIVHLLPQPVLESLEQLVKV